MFRNKLSHIEDEDELFEYFKEHAGYSDAMHCYVVAGIAADDTAVLLKKLREEWKLDCLNDAALAKTQLKKEIDDTQTEIDQLEEVKGIVTDNHQKLLTKMNELVIKLSEL